MLDSLQKLVAIPSVTEAEPIEGKPFGREVSNALSFVLNLCEGFGFRVKNVDNYLGYAEIGEGKELIGILCHLDVVPVGNDWTHDPFKGEIVDGKMYGRGVTDDKGPTVAVIYAMKDILDSGIHLNKRIRIIFGCQEESGDWVDMDYYKSHEEIPSYGFTPDADFPAIYGEKGILMLSLSMPYKEAGFETVKGGVAPNMVADYAKASILNNKAEIITLEEKGKSAHGSTPEQGENAISKLMDRILNMEDVHCQFAKFYMDKIGYCLDCSKINCGLHDEASGGLTFNVGKIESKDEKVSVAVDIRYPVTYSLDEVIARITEAVKSYGVEVSILTHMEPVYMDKDGEIIKILMSAYKDITGDETEAIVMGGGTYARAMKNIVAFGPVFPGRECTEHQKDEYIYVEDLKKAREIYKLAIERMLEK